MPTGSASSGAPARGARRPQGHAQPRHDGHSRRAGNLSTLSTTTHASDSSRGHHLQNPNASFSTTSTSSRGQRSPTHETTSLLHNVHFLQGGAGPSTIYEEDDAQFFELQLFAYRMIYVFQGAFLGLIGPSLSYFSKLAMDKAGLNSPVSSFGPIFAAHGGAALVMSFMSELVLNVAIEMDIMKNLTVGLLVCSGVWYACLPPVAAATGNLGVSIYFIAKGFWTALINISLNRCVLWVAARDRQRAAMGESIKLGRELVTSMNFAYGFGVVLGPVIACILNELQIELSFAYYGLGIAQVIPAIVIAMMPSPKPLYGRDQNQTLLGFEDPTRRVPTVPSPIVGGVFLHPRHVVKSANCNPDTYDSLNNLIILLVTINATVLFGIQLGLAAFLFDYVGHVLSVAPHALAHDAIYVWGCVLVMLFWASLWLSYLFFSTYRFHENNMYSICVLSVVCLMSSFGILFGGEAGLASFVACLLVFAFALAPLFTLSIHCLTTVINELLIRRVSSLIVFGCGMGEIFIPVTMGFFMGNYSGQTYGSVAVSYILFILSICLVGTSSMLLMMVKRKVDEVRATRGDDAITVARLGGGGGGHNKRSTSSTSSYQRGG